MLSKPQIYNRHVPCPLHSRHGIQVCVLYVGVFMTFFLKMLWENSYLQATCALSQPTSRILGGLLVGRKGSH